VKLAVKLGKKVAAKVAGNFLIKIKRSIDEPEINALMAREMGEVMAILEGRELVNL
jgi:hypothetical protein